MIVVKNIVETVYSMTSKTLIFGLFRYVNLDFVTGKPLCEKVLSDGTLVGMIER